jgi:hypothetical protein
MQELFMMVMNDDLKTVAQVSEDFTFLIDQTKLNMAFEGVDKTADKVAHSL